LSDPVFTLAVWDCAHYRWHALVTSPRRELVDGIHVQLVNLVMVFAAVVEVPRDDDEAVVAALAMLPRIHPGAVLQSYFDLLQYLSQDQGRAFASAVLAN